MCKNAFCRENSSDPAMRIFFTVRVGSFHKWGNPTGILKCDNPYYRDSQAGAPNFRNPRFAAGVAVLVGVASRAGEVEAKVMPACSEDLDLSMSKSKLYRAVPHICLKSSSQTRDCTNCGNPNRRPSVTCGAL